MLGLDRANKAARRRGCLGAGLDLGRRMRAFGGGDLLALVRLDPGQDIRHRSQSWLLETATRCFSRAPAAPLSSDFLPSATPSFRSLALPATINAAAALRRATSRKALGLPSSTDCSATALASASPPLSASPPTRPRPASSGVTSKRRTLPFSSAA